MKKKTVKKLELAKETVRNLAEPEMKDAAGGSNTMCWTEISCGQQPTLCNDQPTTSC